MESSRAVMNIPKGAEKAGVSPSLVMDCLCDFGQVTSQSRASVS